MQGLTNLLLGSQQVAAAAWQPYVQICIGGQATLVDDKDVHLDQVFYPTTLTLKDSSTIRTGWVGTFPGTAGVAPGAGEDDRFSYFAWRNEVDSDMSALRVALPHGTTTKKYLVDVASGTSVNQVVGGIAQYTVREGTGYVGGGQTTVWNSPLLANRTVDGSFSTIRADAWVGSQAAWLARPPNNTDMVEVDVQDRSSPDQTGIEIKWTFGNQGQSSFWRLNFVRIWEEAP